MAKDVDKNILYSSKKTNFKNSGDSGSTNNGIQYTKIRMK